MSNKRRLNFPSHKKGNKIQLASDGGAYLFPPSSNKEMFCTQKKDLMSRSKSVTIETVCHENVQ